MSSALLLLSLAGFLALTVGMNLWERNESQFSFLADSFLHADLAFQRMPGQSWTDTSPYKGQYYWPLGPLPAIILMPLELVSEAFGAVLYQGYVQPLFVLAVLVIVYRIARVTGYSVEDSAYLAFGFGFATVFLGVGMLPWSWFFSQVITCLLVFAAIFEMITRRRSLALGVLFALVLATRVTAVLGVLWCIAEILRARDPWRKKLGSLISISLPILVVAALLMAYNHARFNNAFDSGYSEQILAMRSLEQARTMGIVSLRHVPGNLYALLLSAPAAVRRNDNPLVLVFPYIVASPWGMSIWVTSPCFLYLLWLRHHDATSRLLLLTSLVTAVPILLYYGIGGHQFGYRYSLDFLPLLYYLLLRNYRQQRGYLTAGFKALLLGSAVCNLYLFTGYYVLRVGW